LAGRAGEFDLNRQWINRQQRSRGNTVLVVMDDEEFTQLAVTSDKRGITRAEMVRTLVREHLMKNDRTTR
jgi:hypothetical protein